MPAGEQQLLQEDGDKSDTGPRPAELRITSPESSPGLASNPELYLFQEGPVESPPEGQGLGVGHTSGCGSEP